MAGPIVSARLQMPQVERREADAPQGACTPLATGLASSLQGVNTRLRLPALRSLGFAEDWTEGAPRAQ